MYKIEKLIENASDTTIQVNGKWVPKRPAPFYGLTGWKMRIVDAWAVLRGKADAFTWPEDRPEKCSKCNK